MLDWLWLPHMQTLLPIIYSYATYVYVCSLYATTLYWEFGVAKKNYRDAFSFLLKKLHLLSKWFIQCLVFLPFIIQVGFYLFKMILKEPNLTKLSAWLSKTQRNSASDSGRLRVTQGDSEWLSATQWNSALSFKRVQHKNWSSKSAFNLESWLMVKHLITWKKIMTSDLMYKILLKVPTKPKVNVTVKLFQYDKISWNRFSDDKNEGKRTEDKWFCTLKSMDGGKG